uniref:Uncharacterized protein n=1 Tax=Oryza glumipatula TaxID=40148 RepID=A0A0E0ARZ3_9ORYZ
MTTRAMRWLGARERGRGFRSVGERIGEEKVEVGVVHGSKRADAERSSSRALALANSNASSGQDALSLDAKLAGDASALPSPAQLGPILAVASRTIKMMLAISCAVRTSGIGSGRRAHTWTGLFLLLITKLDCLDLLQGNGLMERGYIEEFRIVMLHRSSKDERVLISCSLKPMEAQKSRSNRGREI